MRAPSFSESVLTRFFLGCLLAATAATAAAADRPLPALESGHVQELLHTYRGQRTNIDARRLRFTGVSRKDVYNPTAPFQIDGKEVIAARVETRGDSRDSQVYFFERHGRSWRPIPGA